MAGTREVAGSGKEFIISIRSIDTLANLNDNAGRAFTWWLSTAFRIAVSCVNIGVGRGLT